MPPESDSSPSPLYRNDLKVHDGFCSTSTTCNGDSDYEKMYSLPDIPEETNLVTTNNKLSMKMEVVDNLICDGFEDSHENSNRDI